MQQNKQSSQLFADDRIGKLEIFTEILRHTNSIKNENQQTPSRKVSAKQKNN